MNFVNTILSILAGFKLGMHTSRRLGEMCQSNICTIMCVYDTAHFIDLINNYIVIKNAQNKQLSNYYRKVPKVQIARY